MGKKEKLVDLKPKADKISDEHLKEMQNIVNTINSIQFNVGKIEGQKHTLLHDLSISQKRILLYPNPSYHLFQKSLHSSFFSPFM